MLRFVHLAHTTNFAQVNMLSLSDYIEIGQCILLGFQKYVPESLICSYIYLYYLLCVGINTSERETIILISVDSFVPSPFMALCSRSAKYRGRFLILITEK